MPKRIVDGEGIWRSDKLAKVEPSWMRAEYANLLPLALANGVFEADSRRVWSLVYSYNRPEITVHDVEQMFDELQRVTLLFRWLDPSTRKVWGFWVGIDKVGRLPSPSRLKKKHESIGPDPPAEDLKAFLASSPDNQRLADGQGGFGFGSGLGSGNGKGYGEGAPENGAPKAQDKPRPSPSAFTGLHLSVTEKQDQTLAEAFPWVDRQAEYRKADSWLEANPRRRPRRSSAFLHNWFARIQEPSSQRGGVSRAEQRTRNNIRAVSGLLH